MDQKAADIIDQLLSGNLSEDAKSNLELELIEYPELYTAYIQLEEDKSVVFSPSDIHLNPFLFQKIKQRMQHNVRSFPANSSRKLVWAPYAAILSFGILSGVFLGNQVEVEVAEDFGEITSDFIVDDYELEETYLMEYSDE